MYVSFPTRHGIILAVLTLVLLQTRCDHHDRANVAGRPPHQFQGTSGIVQSPGAFSSQSQPSHKWSPKSRSKVSYRRNPYHLYHTRSDASQRERTDQRPVQARQTSPRGQSQTLDKTPFIQTPQRGNPSKPNILLMMTDDLDVELGSLNYMPKLMKILGKEGAIFSNSFTSTPMCCPSRSSMLTGMYIHNHEVYTNNQNCSSLHWRNTHERRSFASYLDNAGYRTGYFGKYLNRYNGSHVPDGWREWGGLVGNSRYYNYTVNRNGRSVKYGNRYPQDYYPHVITTDGIQFLRNNRRTTNDPFMLVLSYPSPHGPEDSAPEHSHRFFNSSDHHTASYNYAPNPDKQWILQYTDRMSDLQLKYTDLLMAKRLQTLQTVDESVEKVITELKALGQLDNTYIFFTSDHGYHLGQFGLAKGKSMPFEFDIKVPFIVRGPGVKSGVRIPEISLNIDLAPTFLDIAGVKPPSHMDGRSLKEVLEASSVPESKVQWRDSFIIESSGRIRDEEELQKKVQRTWQREKAMSMGASPDEASSKQSTLFTSKHEKFQEVCAKHDLQSPCTPTQKWFCVQNGDRWRLKKCRPKQSLWRKRCICQSPFGLGTYRKLHPQERRKQKKFLKKHLNRRLDLADYKFIQAFNNVHIVSGWESRKKHKRSKKKRKTARRRNKRDISLNNFTNTTDPDDTFDGDFEDESLHAFVEEKELRDLKDQIFDISDELHVLEDVSNLNVSKTNPKNPQITDLPMSVYCTSNETCSDKSTVENISKEALHDHILRLKKQLTVIRNIYSHLQSQRPNLDVLDLEQSKDYYGGKSPPSDHVPPFQFENEALIVSPEENYDDQLSVMPILPKQPSGSPKMKAQGMTSDQIHTKSSFMPTNYLDTTISMSNGHQLYPIALSLLLDELTISENEQTEPLCWCDKRVLRRLELQKMRSERREERRMIKKKRMKQKFEKKQKKKEKLQWCNHPNLHCYAHDNSHWKTPPLWTDGYFCFCMSASNNTYWCLRTINEKHDFLYCEFITGLITYFDHHIDPYQLRNVAFTLTNERVVELHNKLTRLRVCSGEESCHKADQLHYKESSETPVQIHKRKQKQTLKDKIEAASENTVYRDEFYDTKEQKRKIKKMKRLKQKIRRKINKEKKGAKQDKYASLLGLPEDSLQSSLIENDPKERFPRKSRHKKHRKKKRRHNRKRRKKND